MFKERLKKAWSEAVKNGIIQHDFQVKNEKWRFGLKQIGKNYSYFAYNLTKDKKITAQIIEKSIPGTNFKIQLNEFRALRPVHEPKELGPQPDIQASAHDCRFHCTDNKNSLSIKRRAILSTLKLKNYSWNFYSNAFPYDSNGHFLIIPTKNSRLAHYKQAFDKKLLLDTLELIKKTDGLIIIFQSLHAGASVNHFHLQAFFHDKKCALDYGVVKDNVLDNYPVPAFVYRSGKEDKQVQKAIEILQEEKVPFDLISLKKNIYIFPRNPDHEVVSEFPQGVIGAMELAGKFVTTDKKTYQNFNIHKLYRSLNKTCFEI